MKNRKNTFLMIFFFLVVTGVWIAPGILHLEDFLFHPNAQFSDVLISHWPNAQFIRDALLTWKTIPLWNPLILSGAPLVGDPLFGIWYPPNWLCYLLPIATAINILFWLHLTWAGLGMFYWMRSEGFHWGGALAAGIAFSGMPKLVGHIGLGHLSLVSAIAWTPWLLLATRHMISSLSSPGIEILKRFALGGLVAGILFIADPRWILPAIGLTILYEIRTYYHERSGLRYDKKQGVVGLSVGILMFAGIISGLAIPMIESTLHSTRMNLSIEESTQLSIPIKNLIGVFIPQYGAWPETMSFSGLVILGLAFAAIVERRKYGLFWLGVGLGSLVLALGDQTPVYPFLFDLFPVINLLRAPARFSFLGFFSLFVLAGSGLDFFIRNGIAPENKRWIKLGLVGLSALMMVLSFGSMLILKNSGEGEIAPWIHMVLCAILVVVVGFYSLRGTTRKEVIVTLWVVPILLDLFLMNRSLLEIRSRDELFETHAEIKAILGSPSSKYRTFSPSYSIPQHIGAYENIQLADGVNPIQMKKYWDFMAQAVGFDSVGYSVTLPPFPDGDPYSPLYQDLNPIDLGLLNIGYILSEYPLSIHGLEKLDEVEGTYVYWNSRVRPRAWIESVSGNPAGEWRQVEKLNWSPNQIFIEAEGEGLLVLSEIAYPGWEAFVDGSRVEIGSYKGILRSVSLSPGEHRIAFYFRPLSVKIGASFTFLTLIVFLLLWWRK